MVYAVGRLLRLSMTNLKARIQFEVRGRPSSEVPMLLLLTTACIMQDLPSTSRLVALCQDIYIARAEGELQLEHELYFALISIYRSPQVLFELTKRKEA